MYERLFKKIPQLSWMGSHNHYGKGRQFGMSEGCGRFFFHFLFDYLLKVNDSNYGVSAPLSQNYLSRYLNCGIHCIFSYNGSTCVEFVKDCCGKNFTSNDSCELVPHLPGITYQLVVELKVELKLDPYCRLSLSEEKEEFNDINIDRLHKYA